MHRSNTSLFDDLGGAYPVLRCRPLRKRRTRPGGYCAAEKRNELAPLHSGSKADKPLRAKIRLCPLSANSGHRCFDHDPHREFRRGCDLQHRSLDAPDPYFECQADGPLLGEWSMRMPLLSYFLVAGTVLFGALVLVGNKLEPKPLPVSQMVGVPAAFKAPPEDVQSRTSAVNFDRQNL
jgi:hypothetical protein